jgi:hypothetical protein
MTDEEEAALIFQRSLGGLYSLSPEDRARVETIRDVQLERAEDLLEGILLYSHLSNPEKVAVK